MRIPLFREAHIVSVFVRRFRRFSCHGACRAPPIALTLHKYPVAPSWSEELESEMGGYSRVENVERVENAADSAI